MAVRLGYSSQAILDPWFKSMIKVNAQFLLFTD